MSTQEPEFKVGQQVKDGDYDRLPVGAVTSGIEKTGETQWRKVDGPPMLQQPHATRVLTYLPDTPATEAYCVKDGQEGDWWVSEATPEFGYGIVYDDGTHPTKDNELESIEAIFGIDTGVEPEGATDAYVEPEPLKEGDWVHVWAQVDNAQPDMDGDLTVTVPMGVGNVESGVYVRPDAIVRPDAGQVPPWVTITAADRQSVAISKVLIDEGGMDPMVAHEVAESLIAAGCYADEGGDES